MKKAENFRLGDVTRAKLSRLADGWGCSKTSVIDQLIMDCDERLAPGDAVALSVDELPVPRPGKIEEVPPVGSKKYVPRPGVRAGTSSVHRQKIEQPSWKTSTGVDPVFSAPVGGGYTDPNASLTREEREAKIDAFQRGMSSKGRKK